MSRLPDGPFTRDDLARCGVGRSVLDRFVATGEVRKVLHHVYCRADVPDSVRLRAAAAALVLPAHVVVCDRSAAWLHGIDAFDPDEVGTVPPLEVVSYGGHDRVRREGTYAGKRALCDADISVLEGGVLVTSPARTACDLATLRGRRTALAVLDAFRRRFDLSEADLIRMLPRFSGRRGVTQLRQLIPLSTDLAESMPESWTRCVILDEGLPAPTPQVEVWVDGYGLVRLDLGYRGLKVAVEYDGEEHHSSAADRAADERRRAALRADGWIVIVVRRADLAHPASERWLTELRDAIAERQRPHRRRHARGEQHPAYRRRRPA
ncbi:type IV toxin-antitoxin system AbiEi family antitoxin domain-containing protein [Nocardioides marmotae]|uniref:type IV toxin-antitoxin system AbiEi family antitoxin domain-containing protein n=1 Tax=Nocardioides marmotae TaxID=2663857 RepID=UPI0012B66EB9|nr:type IV toxin-antitoxin system AbiEi family antitoxin domain-containing protein [Nocardioides marmotae]MBC9732698.1 type IV toxin-antitoxin system AbiEi family antitoxin domain-containing protein [Nocardioides marmotae]MTB83815.1 hypothetical protein [Nocardioides marmotae]